MLRRRLAEDTRLDPDAVLSSTMRRAAETAEIITEGLDVPLQTLEELCERSPGECEGMTYDQYRATYGREPWSDWIRPLSPGGESDEEFVARVRGVIGHLAEECRGQTVWLVCHGGVIMATAAVLMQGGSGIDAPKWENPAPTAISEWSRTTSDGTDGPWTLRRYNDHAHLVL